MTNWSDIKRSTEPWPWQRIHKETCITPTSLALSIERIKHMCPENNNDVTDMDELNRTLASEEDSVSDDNEVEASSDSEDDVLEEDDEKDDDDELEEVEGEDTDPPASDK